MQNGNWNYPTSIRFGPGRIAELPEACGELAIFRPLLVTDPGVTALPWFAGILTRLAREGMEVEVFSDVRSNPTGDNVAQGVVRFRDAGCDGVIALGGGSALDAGKAIALMVGQDRPLWDFVDEGDNWKRVRVDGLAPLVAVPTTSGTGSEVGRCSVITDPAAKAKRLIFHPRLLPARVIADPSLTLALPPKLTAGAGMDALAHCLEAYCSPLFHPMADGIALEGMRLVHRSLLRAYRDGSNLEARSDMLAAALMGATAFQKGLGAIHSMSHPLGAWFDTHHGLTNAVVMPYVLEFNRPAIEQRLASAAAYLGLARASFDGFLAWVRDLRSQLGIPDTLRDLGVTPEALEQLSREAAADPSAGTNPLPVGVEEHLRLFQAAMGLSTVVDS